MLKIVSITAAILIILLNIVSVNKMTSFAGGHLVCISDYTRYFSFGNDSQFADFLWLRFLQEIDAFNEFKISESHLCADKSSSWHYHTVNLAMDLDPKFIEIALVAPLIISVTISDSIGASKLFDKAVLAYPNNWRILFQASYQAQFEEKNLKKTADLLYRAGINGAPKWVFSLSGGIYNEIGSSELAKNVYSYLQLNFPNDLNTQRLSEKLQKKIKNFYSK